MRPPPKLRLIQGGRSRPVRTIPGAELLQDLGKLSHEEATSFVIGEIRDFLQERGAYRVGRLFRPGYVEITQETPRGWYTVSTHAPGGKRIALSTAPTISIAAFALLEAWEEE